MSLAMVADRVGGLDALVRVMLSHFGPDCVESAVHAGRRRIGQIVATSQATGKALPPRPALHERDLAWVQKECIQRLWKEALHGARHYLGVVEYVDRRTGCTDDWSRLSSVRCPRLRMQLAASAVLLVVRLARGSLPCRVQTEDMPENEIELGISGILGHAFWFAADRTPAQATAPQLVNTREWREPTKSKAEKLQERWLAMEANKSSGEDELLSEYDDDDDFFYSPY
jgi:hypothetical protein